MSEEPIKGTKTQLAVALAQGHSVAKWARDNDVPRTTAFRWARDPEVRKAVESCRRRVMDQAVGRMTGHTAEAIKGIVRIAWNTKSDTVELRAWLAVISDMMAVSKYSGMEVRMTEIEARLDARD